MSGVSYPFDQTGLSPANLVVDEIHTLTEINDVTYRIIIPEFSPFYLDNLVVRHTDSTGVTRDLIPDVEYVPCLLYVGATRSIAKVVYGGLSINTELLNGVIKITYQTMGGDFCADANYVLERIASSNYNPRTAIWDTLSNVQDLFPPIQHPQNIDTIYGYQQLIDAINALAQTIVGGPNPSLPIVMHLTDSNNPHTVTKAQVGLSDVVNLPLASPDDIANKAPVDKYITLAQALELFELKQN